ncbi:ribosomal protein L16, partial [Atractiella rhizophila]
PLFSPSLFFAQVRHRGRLSPRKFKYPKAQRGVSPIPITSVKGTTVAFGSYGVRITRDCFITAKQLEGCQEVIRRQLKPIRGSQWWMRVFPNVPICVKGNETRMGKGKGSFSHWATRCKPGRVIFEVGGPTLREEIAREIVELVGARLPSPFEFVKKDSPAFLGTGAVGKPTVKESVVVPTRTPAKSEEVVTAGP